MSPAWSSICQGDSVPRGSSVALRLGVAWHQARARSHHRGGRSARSSRTRNARRSRCGDEREGQCRGDGRVGAARLRLPNRPVRLTAPAAIRRARTDRRSADYRARGSDPNRGPARGHPSSSTLVLRVHDATCVRGVPGRSLRDRRPRSGPWGSARLHQHRDPGGIGDHEHQPRAPADFGRHAVPDRPREGRRAETQRAVRRRCSREERETGHQCAGQSGGSAASMDRSGLRESVGWSRTLGASW